MFSHLHIYDPRERALVGVADLGLAALTAPLRLARRLVPAPGPPGRILLLRLERIGDLLMTLDALEAVRRLAPAAAVDLVVGSWNLELARLLPGTDRVETVDAPWLSRPDRVQAGPDPQGAGPRVGGAAIVRRALEWRSRQYDLGLNFEPDLRSNLLLGLAAPRRRVGFDTAGGGALLTDRLRHDPALHTAENSLRLVERAFDRPAGSIPPLRRWPRLRVPAGVRETAAALVSPGAAGLDARPRVGLHVSGGRAVKQWDVERFAAVALHAATQLGADVILTGAADDRPLTAAVGARLPRDVRVIDLAGQGGLTLTAALLERLDVLVTGDTGPMHLAAAMGTPIVAIFGPSDPRRYAPLGPSSRIVRIDLPCSPCNRIRLPPARCVGHVPDCLQGVTVEAVNEAVAGVLSARHPARRSASSPLP